MRSLIAGSALLLAIARAGAAHAQPVSTHIPFDSEVRRHYFAQLARSPWRALGWELLLPGAGSVYTGVHAAAAVSLSLTLAGSCMWIAGARRDRSALRWAGVASFAAGRAHGLISAPVSAVLLNAAFRRQLGLTARF
jgi:hypothetical protein